MILLIDFFLLFQLYPRIEAACTLAQRREIIPRMKIQRPNPGMYYAVDTSKRNYDVNGCPTGTIPATIRDVEEWWDHFWLDQGTLKMFLSHSKNPKI